jgi:hypothetical protein
MGLHKKGNQVNLIDFGCFLVFLGVFPLILGFLSHFDLILGVLSHFGCFGPNFWVVLGLFWANVGVFMPF